MVNSLQLQRAHLQLRGIPQAQRKFLGNSKLRLCQKIPDNRSLWPRRKSPHGWWRLQFSFEGTARRSSCLEPRLHERKATQSRGREAGKVKPSRFFESWTKMKFLWRDQEWISRLKTFWGTNPLIGLWVDETEVAGSVYLFNRLDGWDWRGQCASFNRLSCFVAKPRFPCHSHLALLVLPNKLFLSLSAHLHLGYSILPHVTKVPHCTDS